MDDFRRTHFICTAKGCEFKAKGRRPMTDHYFSEHVEEYDKDLHGTETGYQRHRKLFDEEPCDPCKEAHRTYNREWMRQYRRGYGSHPTGAVKG